MVHVIEARTSMRVECLLSSSWSCSYISIAMHCASFMPHRPHMFSKRHLTQTPAAACVVHSNRTAA